MSPSAGSSRSQVGASAACRVRILYRDGTGELHLNWPIAKLAEAIQNQNGTLWVDLEDPLETPSAQADFLLRDVFGFHPLAVDDALRESHVPKIDDWDEYIYLVFHSSRIDPENDSLQLQELDVFLGPNFLVTYHQGPLVYLTEAREAIEHDPRDRMKDGADHLLFRFLDRSVDQSLDAIETLDERIDGLQDSVLEKLDPADLQKLFRIKRATIQLQKTFSPQRDVLSKLARDPYAVVKEEHRVYFRDVYDHIVRIHDISEGLRDLIIGVLDTYLSVMSNRTNEIMKTLTMVTVMFMPMSFVVGFFGMNFFGASLQLDSWLPKWTLFLGSLTVMLFSPVVMLALAKRWGWF